MTNECKACKAELSPGVNHYCRGSQRVTREDLEVLTEAVRKLDNRVESHSMSIMYLTQAVKGSGENISNAFVEIHKLADKHDALGHQHIELEIERLKDQLRTIGRAIVDSPTGTIVCKREEPVTREVPAVEQDDVSVTREEFDALESRIRLLEIADAEQGRKNTRFDARLSAIERALPIGVPGELRIRNLRVTPIGEHAAREKNTGAVAQPEEQGGHEPLRDAGSTPAGTHPYKLSERERELLWTPIHAWRRGYGQHGPHEHGLADAIDSHVESLVTRAVQEERERALDIVRSACVDPKYLRELPGIALLEGKQS